jgi:hypothetical protein
MLERIATEVDTRFQVWAFRGSLVDWHYFDGQVMVKDFDIVTSDPFEPQHVCHFWGPRMSWKFMGRSIDVFYEADPGPRMQTIEARVERLKWLIEKIPTRADKYREILARYEAPPPVRQARPGVKIANDPSPSKSCPHRGEQLRTMTSDLCGTRGHNLPVYSCAVHGECTHRQVCKGQDAAVKICVGCSDGPWAF